MVLNEIGLLHIRADAGGSTGTGHVMRMLALAQAYQRGGGKVNFVCAHLPEAVGERLLREGCKVVLIDAEPGSDFDAEQTLSVVHSALGKERAGKRQKKIPAPIAPWLIIDGYHFNYDYQKAIKKSNLSLMCVDDHGYSDRWYCDAILNQNLDADKVYHYQCDLPDTQLLLGSNYCLLRREFLQPQRPVKTWGTIQKLLVTLGGSDPDNATGAVLELLNQSCRRALDIRVLLGADNPHAKKIQSIPTHHRIEILRGVSNMPEQYAWADGIISAGGSTCWEWLYFGLPGAIVTIADNQLPIVEALSKTRRAALSLGWFCKCDQNAKLKSVGAWLDSPAPIIDQTEARSMIDGMGSLRVASFLMGTDEYCPSRSPVDSMS